MTCLSASCHANIELGEYLMCSNYFFSLIFIERDIFNIRIKVHESHPNVKVHHHFSHKWIGQFETKQTWLLILEIHFESVHFPNQSKLYNLSTTELSIHSEEILTERQFINSPSKVPDDMYPNFQRKWDGLVFVVGGRCPSTLFVACPVTPRN